jgi:hypothetical protein
VSLELVQQIEHALDCGFAGTPIAGLDGDVQQRSHRPSHRIRIRGLLTGDSANDDLASLQKAAAAGAEITFSADIAKALDLQRVVIAAFRAVEDAGRLNRYDYEVTVVESPPLPPPAEVAAFGGLGEFGLGDLGIDPGALQGISSLAGEIGAAVDQAMSAVSQLGALVGGLAHLPSASGLMEPMSSLVDNLKGVGGGFGKATSALGGVLG